MILKDISLSSPIDNVLYDEVLFNMAESGKLGESLRFWESSCLFVVLGRIGNVNEDLKIETIQEDNIPVLRRCSGGGTVLQGKGCLNFSLVLSKDQNRKLDDLKASYQFILGDVVNALANLGIQGKVVPISDIAFEASLKKFSGNAQKRGRKFILHHGTILYNFDLALIEKYLRIPNSVPEYRNNRGHLDFVANINVASEDIKAQLAAMFNIKKTDLQLTTDEAGILEELKSNGRAIVSL